MFLDMSGELKISFETRSPPKQCLVFKVQTVLATVFVFFIHNYRGMFLLFLPLISVVQIEHNYHLRSSQEHSKIGQMQQLANGLEHPNSPNYGRFENLQLRLSTRIVSQQLIALTRITQKRALFACQCRIQLGLSPLALISHKINYILLYSTNATITTENFSFFLVFIT